MIADSLVTSVLFIGMGSFAGEGFLVDSVEDFLTPLAVMLLLLLPVVAVVALVPKV